MKNSFKKTVLFVLSMSMVGFASAHSQNGSLGKKTTSAAATDVYMVNCYDDGEGAGVPDKIFVRVKDVAPKLAPAIGVQVIKGGIATALSIDAVDGDANYSPVVTLKRGAGDYTVTVNKLLSNVKDIDSYALEFHCETAKGDHAGTDISMSQNQ